MNRVSKARGRWKVEGGRWEAEGGKWKVGLGKRVFEIKVKI